MRRLRLWLRFVHVLAVVALALLLHVGRRLWRGSRLSAAAREQMLGEAIAGLLERLGATFIKLGQISSTRPDLLGPGLIGPLARLQDAVPAAPFAEIERVLGEELAPERRSQIASIEREPVAAASVAQVHRATLVGGETIALKVQRLRARDQIERDLAILGFMARLLDRIPALSMLSLPGSVERFGVALHGQLDFRAEARHNRRFAKNFAAVSGVSVPALLPELSSARVLAMEFVEGVKATEPEKVGGDRARLARLGGEAVLKMIFEDGFVHADLHPGNIILTSDDRVVLIDLGMVSDIPRDLLRPWVETFVALSARDGALAARLFYEYAPSVRGTDYAAFERDVVAYLAELYGKRLGDVEISVAVSGMMNVLRKHHVQIDPSFTVVNIALLVAEGLGKQLDPSIDLVPLAQPYLARAMLTAPTPRPPLRAAPGTEQRDVPRSAA
jgi:ubiquinone biosynthesis protein